MENVDAIVVGAGPAGSAAAYSLAKNELQFPLIADKELNVVKLYDVLKLKTGSAQRSTFLIDREGIIRFVWPKVRVPGHVDEIISKIGELKL